MPEKDLIVLRGLPGSGKSLLAEVLSEHGRYPVFSIDDYFTDAEGNYHFRFQDNHKAYQLCEERTEAAMQTSVSKIFVDNVFSLEWEIEPYFKLASVYGYRMHIVTVENRHGGSNVHGVDKTQLDKIAQKFKVKLF